MPANIIIAGISGRMGREIASIILADDRYRLVGGLEYPGHPSIGVDIGVHLGRAPLGIPVVAALAETGLSDGVVIDFTAPEASLRLVESASGTNIRFVIGTTGLSAEQTAILRAASSEHAILHSPNMSLGVNFLFHLTKLAAERLGNAGYDIEIIEAHHRFKKDSPSGTAKRLGEIAASAIGQSYDESIKNGRDGIVGERSGKEIGMHAVRGGDIIGDHTVLFAALGEHIELKHTATNRATFAMGAVHAAGWMSSQAPGWYSMSDILGI